MFVVIVEEPEGMLRCNECLPDDDIVPASQSPEDHAIVVHDSYHVMVVAAEDV